MKVGFEFTERDVRRVLFWLIAFETAFALLAGANALMGAPSWLVNQLFNLDLDSNVPAWFSSVQFFVTALVFFYMSAHPDRRQPSPRALLMVGAAFLFLSVDEAASIHERISIVLRNNQTVPRFSGGHGVWISIYAVIGIVLLLLNVKGLLALWRRHRQATVAMVLGFATLVLGGVGLEIVSYEFLRGGESPLLYAAEVIAEEFLEMAGASVTLYGAILLMGQRMRAPVPAPLASGSSG